MPSVAPPQRPDPLPAVRFLMSYWYFQRNRLEDQFIKWYGPKPWPQVFADSGAFSAMTQGGTLDVRAYGKWLLDNLEHLTVYANLDVIKNAKATWENQRRLEDMGLHPLPVFHVAEDWKYLEYYLERYDYIALGVAGTHHRDYMPWLTKCFKLSAQIKKPIAFHGFGITSWTPLRSFPWYSVDSSSWGGSYRYGRVLIWNPRLHEFETGNLQDPATVYRLGSLLRDLGVDPRDVAMRDRVTRQLLCVVPAVGYLQAEVWLRSYHGLVHLPSAPDLPGLRIYLADTSTGNFGKTWLHYRDHLPRAWMS